MLNKFRRFIRKFPGTSFLLAAGITAYAIQILYTDSAARLMLQAIAVIALFQVANSIRHTWQHGFFGVHLLPGIGIVAALIQSQLWTAFILAIIVAIEKPMICFLQRGRTPQSAKASNLTNVQHAPLPRKLDRLSVPYIILVILAAGSVWVTSDAPDRFLRVVAAASTAPLLLAVPAAYITGIKRAGKRSIVFASASSFEKLGHIQSLFLYKSGIVTTNDTTVAGVRTFGKRTKSEVMQIAGSLASVSEHPLSRAIVSHAGGELKIIKAKHAKEKPHEGISGRVRGSDLHIGRLNYLQDKGIILPPSFTEPSKTAVYVAVDDVLVGVITFNETYFEGAKNLAAKLKKFGLVRVALLSHGSEIVLKVAANDLRISDFSGGTNPGGAVSIIQNSKNRPAALVADAHTDSTALVAADVAITPEALEPGISDVALLDYKPTLIPEAYAYAKKTIRIAKLTALLGIWLTLVLLIVAGSGKVEPLYLAIGQLAVTLLSLLAPSLIVLKTDK